MEQRARSLGWPTLAAMGVVALMAGCGSNSTVSSATSRAAADLTPCSILTRSDAENAFGKPLRAGAPIKAMDDSATGNSCTYAPADATTSGSVAIMFFGFPSPEAARTSFDKLAGARAQAQPVTGVGETALFLPYGEGSGTLIFVQGATLGQVVLQGGTTSSALEPLRQLAARAASQV